MNFFSFSTILHAVCCVWRIHRTAYAVRGTCITPWPRSMRPLLQINMLHLMRSIYSIYGKKHISTRRSQYWPALDITFDSKLIRNERMRRNQWRATQHAHLLPACTWFSVDSNIFHIRQRGYRLWVLRAVLRWSPLTHAHTKLEKKNDSSHWTVYDASA